MLGTCSGGSEHTKDCLLAVEAIYFMTTCMLFHAQAAAPGDGLGYCVDPRSPILMKCPVKLWQVWLFMNAPQLLH